MGFPLDSASQHSFPYMQVVYVCEPSVIGEENKLLSTTFAAIPPPALIYMVGLVAWGVEKGVRKRGSNRRICEAAASFIASHSFVPGGW